MQCDHNIDDSPTPEPRKDAALALAIKGLKVFPCCCANEHGLCGCGRRHTGHDVGKAPLTKHGFKDSSNSVKEIWNWWEKWPLANIGVDLAGSGLIAVAPDSPESHQEFLRRGMPDTAVVQSGGGEGHNHYYFRASADTHQVRICIPDQYDIMSQGYVIGVGSLHQSGRTYQWVNDYQWKDVEDLPFAPDWVEEMLRQKDEEQNALPEIDIDCDVVELRPELVRGKLEEWYEGKKFVPLANGTPDRSRTLFVIALMLAKQGATAGEIISALRDRDEALEFYKYSRRKDGGQEAYTSIAQKVAQAKAESPPKGEYFKPRDDDVVIDVANSVAGDPPYGVSDKRAGKKGDLLSSPLWDYWCKTFPDPPRIKPWVVSTGLWSEKERSTLVADLRSDTWFNPSNATFKLRKYGFHLGKRLCRFDCFVRFVPADDCSETLHKRILKQVERAEGQWLLVENCVARGYQTYLATVPLEGFEPVDDHMDWLTDALKGIRVPTAPLERCVQCHAVQHDEGKECLECGGVVRKIPFIPVTGSKSLTKGSQGPVDEDRGKYVVIATKKGPTDWVLLEAELIASGKEYEHIPPVYRAQWDQGIRSYGDSFEEARQRFEWMEYRLRRTWKVST